MNTCNYRNQVGCIELEAVDHVTHQDAVQDSSALKISYGNQRISSSEARTFAAGRLQAFWKRRLVKLSTRRIEENYFTSGPTNDHIKSKRYSFRSFHYFHVI